MREHRLCGLSLLSFSLFFFSISCASPVVLTPPELVPSSSDRGALNPSSSSPSVGLSAPSSSFSLSGSSLLVPPSSALAVEAGSRSVSVASLAPSRLVGEAAHRAEVVRGQIGEIRVDGGSDRVDVLLAFLIEHGVLADELEARMIRGRLCPEDDTRQGQARCLLDMAVWAQISLIDGARLGAWRQPLPPHRHHLNAKEKAARRLREEADHVMGVRQVLALLGSGEGQMRSEMMAWLQEAGPGRFGLYNRLVEALARYRNLAGLPLPPLPDDLPVASKHAYRKSSEKKAFLRKFTPAHRRALRERLCFEGYCVPPPESKSLQSAQLAQSAQSAQSPGGVGSAEGLKTRKRARRSSRVLPLDEALASRLRAWQFDRGLRPSALLDAQTLAALRVPMQARVEQISLALERIRDTRVGKEEDFLVANVPAFRLDVYRDRALVRTHRTQVGKGVKKVRRKGRWRWVAGHRTPLMSMKLRYLVLNPEWVVPSSIKREYRFKVAKDPQWYGKNGFEVRIASNGGESLVMKGGPKNVLGVVKFLFPNTHMVYLHDTSAKRYFRDYRRLKSHGCVRVDHAEELARYLIAQDRGKAVSSRRWAKMLDRSTNRWLTLKHPPAIYLTYWTADVSKEGKVRFYPDVYHYDKADRRLAARELKGRIDPRLFSSPQYMPAGPPSQRSPLEPSRAQSAASLNRR